MDLSCFSKKNKIYYIVVFFQDGHAVFSTITGDGKEVPFPMNWRGYTKEGPGVSKHEVKKRGAALFFSIYFRKFFDIMKLNLIYCLFCIPVITIGPATAAATYILRNYVREQHAFLWGDFWKEFKQNFKQSMAVGLLMLFSYGVLFFAVYFYSHFLSQSAMLFIPLVVCAAVLLIISFMGNYLYLLIVTLELRMKPLLKNALILALVGLKQNFLILLFSMMISLPLFLLLPWTVVIVLFFGPTTVIFIQCFLADPLVQKYCVDPFHPKKEEEEDAVFSDEPVEDPENGRRF